MLYPLLPAQKEYYADAFLGNSTKYIIGVKLVFPKVFSYEKMQEAGYQVVRHNDVLRLKFENNGQYFDEFKEWKFPYVQFETQEELEEYTQKALNEQTRIFDKPFDIRIFRCKDVSGYILLGHHLRFDGLSGYLLARDYAYFLGEEKPREFGSFENYLKEYPLYTASKTYEKDKSFWVKKLRSVGVEYYQNSVSLGKVKDTEFYFDGKITQLIQDFCQKNDFNESVVLYSLFIGFYSRIKNLNKFSVGVPVLNRTSQEMNVMGMFMHVLPLYVNAEDKTFIDLLSDVDDGFFELLKHQKFTRYDIVNECKEFLPVSNLFDVSIDYSPFPTAKGYDFDIIYAKDSSLPLEVHFFDRDGKIKVVIRHKEGFFAGVFEDRLQESFLNFIQAVLNDPTKGIALHDFYPSEIPLSALKGERVALPQKTISSYFEDTALSCPDKTCIACDGNKTYREFLDTIKVLDGGIRKITRNAKQTIAVMVDRTYLTYALLFAILRGGNAYLPISHEWPTGRIKDIISSSGVKFVVGEERFLPTIDGVKSISVNDLSAFNGETPPSTACISDDLAYVLYTSGTTGKPKGVKITHRSVVNRIVWMQSTYSCPADVVLQKTPLTFDVSVWETFWIAFKPSEMVTIAPEMHASPSAIIEAINAYGVTHLHFVPSVFKVFVKYLKDKDTANLSTLKHVFLSGENMDSATADDFLGLRACENIRLHNLYGPTECTVDVTYHDHIKGETPIPIGKPIWNTEIYVTDSIGRVLPAGVSGEICVSGEPLSQGYLNDEELTREKFYYNEFIGQRIYKTGDLGYVDKNGEVVFVGRKDSIVKINGQRTSLLEIEDLIKSVGVEDVCVLQKDDKLTCYYNGSVEETLIKAKCLEVLPRGVCPSAFVKLDKMPLKENGKIDENALLSIKIDLQRGELPRDELEKEICDIFKDKLKVDVFRDTDFIYAGGTSLDVYELLSAYDLFKEILPSTFLKDPTPKGVASAIRAGKKNECLQPMTKPSSLSVVCFPYAAGGAEAFTALSKRLSGRGVACYFADVADLQKLSNEIVELTKTSAVVFYAHCIGSGFALEVLKGLEGRVSKLVVGGNIPPKKANSPWTNTPTTVIKALLKKMGAPKQVLNDDTLSRFRRDTDRYFDIMKTLNKVDVDLTPVVWKKDLFTPFAKTAKKEWERFATTVEDPVFIETDNHYFQSSNADVVADIIISKFDR